LLDRIINGPKSFARYDSEHHFSLVRRFPYSIVYRFDSETVYVIAVAHSSRSPDYWHERQ
jgi:hypothetical protein